MSTISFSYKCPECGEELIEEFPQESPLDKEHLGFCPTCGSQIATRRDASAYLTGRTVGLKKEEVEKPSRSDRSLRCKLGFHCYHAIEENVTVAEKHDGGWARRTYDVLSECCKCGKRWLWDHCYTGYT